MPHSAPRPAAARRLPALLRSAALALTLMPQGAAAGTLSAERLDALTDDLLALAAPEGAPDRAAARAELAALDDALAQRDRTLTPLPAALAQGAALARRAEHPASRAVMADLTRDMLITAMTETGADPAASGTLLAAWDHRDPMLAELVPGQGLTADDLEAGRRLAARDPAHEGISVQSFWDQESDEPVNRVLPTRMDAWTEGVLAAWDRLDADQRRQAVEILDNSAVPPPALLKEVLGTNDILGWLGAVDVTLTADEKAASPELLAYMQSGAFAGPVRPMLVARAEARAASGGGGDVIGAMTDQLMRLNNWSAMTGEMHSWESYRYMTQGY